MENKDINFRVKRTALSRSSNRVVIVIEPISQSNIENYHYDIRTLSKDFLVEEIAEDMHFVYASDIKDFFSKHQETKVNDVPVSLLVLSLASEVDC